jgi:transposase
LGHSRKTVRKAIESAEPLPYTLKEPRPSPVLGPHKARIDELLEQNEHLPPKQRYIGHTIFKDIVAKGYTGSESAVRGYIAQGRGGKKKRAVYIPLEFDPGTDAQVDWGEAVAIIAGERVTVQMFLMRLCYSRKLFVKAYPTQKQESFLDGHVGAFHHFQGVPHRISYDNLKAAVQRMLEGHSRQEQRKFIAFRSHYLFESHFCTAGQGHEKGRVEKGVGFSRRNFMVPIPKMASFDDLNAHKAYPFRIDVLHMNDVIASHPRSYGQKQDILDPLHYLPLLEQRPGAFEHAKPIRRWRKSWPPAYERLLTHLRDQWPEGRGVREFVRVLKLHQEHPADLLTRAVEQALEYGCAHADGVQLCLRQLTNPESLVPTIDLTRWPELTDVGVRAPDLQCYDQLLEGV